MMLMMMIGWVVAFFFVGPRVSNKATGKHFHIEDIPFSINSQKGLSKGYYHGVHNTLFLNLHFMRTLQLLPTSSKETTFKQMMIV